VTAATQEAALQPPAKLWGAAVRAYSFPASIVPVLLGSVYAWYARGTFNWLLFIETLIAAMLYHVGSNLVNDYFDYKHGVDREGTFGGSGMLTSGTMTPAQFMQGIVVSLGGGTLLGLLITWQLYTQYGEKAALSLLVVGAAGLLGTIWYTAGKGSAKYNALGEPLVFLMFGFGYVLGAYLVQTGELSWAAALVSIPVGFLVTAILQANDTRDIADDTAGGIRTQSIALGPTGARAYYSALLFGAYVSLIPLSLAKLVPWTALLPLLTLPLALGLHKLFWTVRDLRSEQLMGSVENTAKLHMAFGMLYSIGIIVGGWLFCTGGEDLRTLIVP
jgi:1,4-dihydroxy-2-naphthoate octaprenyltransferase